MKPSLKSRIITALICIPILIIALLVPIWGISAIVIIASFIGLYEYFKTVDLLQHKALCVLGFIAAAVILLNILIPSRYLILLTFAFVFASFLIMLFSNKKINADKVGLLMFGLVYIPYFLSNIILIRDMELGNLFIWLVFIGSFLTDTMAFFVGITLGKHKLCPTISPKKTIEGAIGGTLGGILSFIVFGLIINYFFRDMLNGASLSLPLLAVLGFLVAIASQIGDLTASLIKRHYNIKDFGNIFPGHGGMLDRCDSIILVAPVIYLFLSNINIFIK